MKTYEVQDQVAYETDNSEEDLDNKGIINKRIADIRLKTFMDLNNRLYCPYIQNICKCNCIYFKKGEVSKIPGDKYYVSGPQCTMNPTDHKNVYKGE